MRTFYCVIAIAAAIQLACAADSNDHVPQDRDATALAETFLAKRTKQNSSFPELEGAKLVAAHPLLFRAREDDRPLLVHHFILSAEVELSDKREWWLMAYYRHPSGTHVGEWNLSQQRGMHSPLAFRRLTAQPETKDIQDFLAWIGWESRFEKFRDVKYVSFPSGWKAVTREAPPELKGATLWTPDENSAR